MISPSTAMELKELARACRVLAYHIEQTAKRREGTSSHDDTVAEARYFAALAVRCEQLAAAMDPR